MEGDGAVDDAAAESKSTGEVNIDIRCSDESKFSVQISLESTVESFREAIAQKSDISPDQRLIYKGRVLKNDHQTLKRYGLKDGDTVDLAATTNITGGNKGSTNSNRSPSLTKDPMNAQAGRTQNNTTGSTSGGNAQAPTALGLDPTFIAQIVQNPNFYRIRHSILANPTVAKQIIEDYFEKRGMPEISPYFIQLALQPVVFQWLYLFFQRAFLSLLGQQRSTQESDIATRLQDFIKMFLLAEIMSHRRGTGSLAVPNSNSDEQLYATQLSQLQEMGFSDTQANIRALTASSAFVHEAVKLLWGNSGQ